MATKFKDLTDSFSRSECYCLNENPSHPFGNLFIGDGTLQLKSDADEQLILHLEFQDAVKIHSINIMAPPGETAPRVVKLFANRTSLGFSDAGDIEPTQTIELTDEDLEPNKEIELRFVKFQRVKSVTIFVEENNGAEETVISSLKLFGERIAGTNMNELKKISDE
uniref:PITH domain-containing protein n=1 Tax=Globisporangium ultimum (strain ATCC 200006 / CBS 805.95 / DAOM BR144) TaxID=431595 RepID=K3WS93_GLOUD